MKATLESIHIEVLTGLIRTTSVISFGSGKHLLVRFICGCMSAFVCLFVLASVCLSLCVCVLLDEGGKVD